MFFDRASLRDAVAGDFIGADRRDCRYTRLVLLSISMLAKRRGIDARLPPGDVEKGFR